MRKKNHSVLLSFTDNSRNELNPVLALWSLYSLNSQIKTMMKEKEIRSSRKKELVNRKIKSLDFKSRKEREKNPPPVFHWQICVLQCLNRLPASCAHWTILFSPAIKAAQKKKYSEKIFKVGGVPLSVNRSFWFGVIQFINKLTDWR